MKWIGLALLWLSFVTDTPALAGTLAQFRTVFGDIEVELYDQDKPVTVQNFIRYVQSGVWSQMFIHRCEPNFVIQGGGYYVANYTISGNSPPVYQWVKRNYGGSFGVAFDSIGHILTTGTFNGMPVDFGGTTLAPVGLTDGFVAQYTK